MSGPSAIVIGAGIVGLATARALALKGYSVQVLERNHLAIGASIRNFGMVWPIGQPAGKLYERALRSRSIWKEIGESGAFGYEEAGSLHMAYHPDEQRVLEEFFEAEKKFRQLEWLDADHLPGISEAVVNKDLHGALYSRDELIVDPREAIAALPAYLDEKWGVRFHWGKCASYIADQTVYIGNEEEFEADLILVCSGADFETLFPEEFSSHPLTRCKLQMMRLAQQPANWRIGPALCGGLSLIHYQSFKVAPSLGALKLRYETEMSEYLDWGIHVMVSQNARGELTVGDSHEYGQTHDPFDKEFINKLILDYLKRFAQFKDWNVIETWNGIYPKLTNGDTELFFSPEPGVYILNGFGGAGMTLSFGFAEEMVATIS